LTTHWYASHKTWLAYVLSPFARYFSAMVTIRRFYHQKKYLLVIHASCPVIVVGNITVGGVGKTPFVISLYFFLKERGWNPGIVSRGYKGEYRDFVFVTPTSDPTDVGDEAVLLSRRTEGLVLVCRDRSRAVQVLSQQKGCNIILSDDGLQHYAMYRDLEIAVCEARRQYGNGLCLPAGPLREPVSRLQRVDIVAVNGGHEAEASFHLQPVSFVNVLDASISYPLDFLQGKNIYAMTGIGAPQRFFDSLDQLGANVTPLVFQIIIHLRPKILLLFLTKMS
ncbi:MAG: tetraacyldisaccharide 4'-kinase, partial [Gammaproteobacteria bacterium]|nr:tetraacyldisaccharide 4'-kinase [Gammaproteobacteria bacterium]